jgi:hypothetical protein
MSLPKREGSGAGCVIQCTDPRKDADLYQNVTDPEHCFSAQNVEQIQAVKGIKSTENYLCIVYSGVTISKL